MNVVKLIARELWDNLPVWFVFYITASTTFGFIAHLNEPHYEYAVTFIFPYSVFLIYYYVRYRSDSTIDQDIKVRSYLIVAGLTSAVLAVLIAFAHPVKLGEDWPSHFDQFIYGYETTNISWTILLGVHCFLFRGWKGFLLVFGVVFIYGLILESSGVTMGYFFEDHYHYYLPGFSVPVATMFGWSTIFYLCVFIHDKIRAGLPFINKRNFIVHGFLVAMIAVFFDALIDPFATNFGLWTWNKLYSPTNSLYWFGVPFINYISWFSAVFSFGAFYYFFELKKTSWDRIKKTAAMLLSLPLILLVAGIIEFGSLAMIEGINGPSWRILKEYINAGMPMKREPIKGKMNSTPVK